MKISKNILINKPANEVWKLVGDNFAEVGAWACVVDNSAAIYNTDGDLVGRTCQTAWGEVHEMLSNYDALNMTLSFALDEMPSVFENGQTTLKVSAADSHSCTINITAELSVKPVFTFFMGPIIKTKMNGDLGKTLDDLKHFAETGTVSPKKVKQLQKATSQQLQTA